VVEHLPSKYEAQNSNPSTTKKNKKTKNKKKKTNKIPKTKKEKP
jgi:hypothetical protein